MLAWVKDVLQRGDHPLPRGLAKTKDHLPLQYRTHALPARFIAAADRAGGAALHSPVFLFDGRWSPHAAAQYPQSRN